MIQSILDSDQYKYSMQAAVLSLYPDIRVTYEFVNRRPEQRFAKDAYEHILSAIRNMARLRLTVEELEHLKITCPYLPIWYLDSLSAYRFDPSEVQTSFDNGNLTLNVNGLWWRTILWEVPLLAIISEAYFIHVDKNWTMDGQRQKIRDKGTFLSQNDCLISDFGTRRRRNFEVQRIVVEELSKFDHFVGTSNPYLSYMFPKLTKGRIHKSKGTMAHEWISAHQVLGGIRHCNRDAMQAWRSVYKRALGTALTDTIGSDIFFQDIDSDLAHSFDSLRHDSGPWELFVDKTIKFYLKHEINPLHKSIIFSDGLDVLTAAKIRKYCHNKINCSFGIGTFLTNDFADSKALNIVIKLVKVDGIPVVKLSDTPTKAIGDSNALKVTRWIIDQTPLDVPFGKV